MGRPDIAAVVVAYNDPNALSKALASLVQQDCSIRTVFVIDNSGSNFQGRNKRIVASAGRAGCVYHAISANAGSAGGFACGMRLALNGGFDWIWLLDQDGTAEPDCLRRLLACSRNAEIRAPIVLSIEDGTELRSFRSCVNPLGGLTTRRPRGDEVTIERFGTHGVLISRRVLERIGVYDDRHFFVGFEDHDFAIRALNAGFEIVLVKHARAFHPDLGIKHSAGMPAFARRLLRRLPGVMPPYFGFVRESDIVGSSRAIASYGFIAAKYYSLAILALAVAYSALATLVAKAFAVQRVCLLRSYEAYCGGAREGLAARRAGRPQREVSRID